MQAKTMLDRMEELARLQTVYVEKRDKANAAIPNAITSTTGERQAYQLLFQAAEQAMREVQSCALKLAHDAPQLIEE